MTFLDLDRRSSSRVLSRSSYLSVVKAGLTAGNYRFAREAAIAWLAAFPGDLSMGLSYAQALIGEERLIQALPILQGLCMADVEYLEAAQALFALQDILFERNLIQPEGELIKKEASPLDRKAVFAPGAAVKAYLFSLTGEGDGEKDLPAWATDLWLARFYLTQKQFAQAEQMIRQILSLQSLHPLIAVTHLRYLAANQAINNLETRQKSAARYSQSWPDSLGCALFYADWLLEHGESTHAVALLHQSAARDVGGQVPRRLWGDAHAYVPLWPEKMQLKFGLSIPADVATILGWNRLPSQIGHKIVPPETNVPEPLPWEENDDSPQVQEIDSEQEGFEPEEALLQRSPLIDQRFDLIFTQESSIEDSAEVVQDAEEVPSDLEGSQAAPDTSPEMESLLEGDPIEKETLPAEPRSLAEDLLPVKAELERIAKRLHLSGLTQQDGRFPVYVILSLKNNLDAFYGEQASRLIVEEMEKLAYAVQKRKQWGARVFLADDPENVAMLGIQPVQSGTAWNVKLALTDLDNALSKRGEMVGAVLIVGGPEIVPFHALPNPVDDQDDDVPSDNPYATRDENYFMPEWPTGRLPGGSAADASLLLGILRRLGKDHQNYADAGPWYHRLVNWIFRKKNRRKSSFGYTAAVWRGAAENVFRPIGESKNLNSSPPLGLAGANLEPVKKNGKMKQIPTLNAVLAYFNLHGMENAAEWYGQRDPLDPQDSPDYPIALRPQDIGGNGRYAGKFPQVVFSEACYGLHIYGRGIDQAISLKFLETGSLAVVGSTCMAYGSIDAPLVAADLLGHAFWKFFQDGLPAGEALRQAKIHLAKVMHNRQGYLDGEDQKTIISFVLYGDPLASGEIYRKQSKSIWRKIEALPRVMTVSDCSDETGETQEIPAEVADSVKQVVAQYLPGMANAQMVYSVQRNKDESIAHSHPSGGIGKNWQTSNQANQASPHPSSAASQSESGTLVRRLVTLSKQTPNTHGVHAQVAKLTLDESGKLVKLVVSR